MTAIRNLLNKLSRVLSPPGKEHPPLRRASYDEKYRMTLREWLIHHQKEIVFDQVTWMGVTAYKNPLDCWIYQEIIHEVRPDVIVEIGSRFGGSSLYLAHLMDILKNGIVITIDLNHSDFNVEHERIITITGSSSDPKIVAKVGEYCEGKSVLVIQDGDHDRPGAEADLENYAGFVSRGSYFIMEDGIVDLFHPEDGLGFEQEGPLVAVESFLEKHRDFVIDDSRERYILTYNPKGFLKRIA